MKLTRTPLASAIALVLMGGVAYAAPSHAADPAPAADIPAAPAADTEADKKKKELEAVTVVGIRGAIEASIQSKRDASNHVEVVTAEDIGKMPDHNVADSLMRLPGLNTSSASA